MLVELTLAANGRPVFVNTALIQTVREVQDLLAAEKRCLIHFTASTTIEVAGSIEDVFAIVNAAQRATITYTPLEPKA